MKNQNEIYYKRIQIMHKKQFLNEQINKLNNNLINLQKQCSHKLVLVFDNTVSPTIGKISQYFCPACGKTEYIHVNVGLNNSSFKDSKIINLSSLSKNCFNEHFYPILNYIFNNYDYFYLSDLSEEEATESILNMVELEEKSNKNLIREK